LTPRHPKEWSLCAILTDRHDVCVQAFDCGSFAPADTVCACTNVRFRCQKASEVCCCSYAWTQTVAHVSRTYEDLHKCDHAVTCT